MNLAATDGREEGDFVAGMKRSIPRSKFLIARSHNGGAIFGEFGNALRIEGEEVLDGGSIVEVQRFFGLADNIFQTAKEEHFDANRLRNRGHTGIVARAAASGH